MVYRMPLDGSSPSALGVSGAPIDQFSFLQSEDGNLNVLVRADSVGERHVGAEMAAGDVALSGCRLAVFLMAARMLSVLQLSAASETIRIYFQNRFVGDYLLYGTGSGWGDPQQIGRTKLIAVRTRTFRLPSSLCRNEN